MWPYGMSDCEYRRFLLEYSEILVDVLMDYYPLVVDELVARHMDEEAQEYTSEWEAC